MAPVVTVYLSGAYEVSCRVRVGEHPAARRPAAIVRLNPKECSVLGNSPALTTPKWVPRLCHTVRYGPGEVAEFGVRPRGFSEG